MTAAAQMPIGQHAWIRNVSISAQMNFPLEKYQISTASDPSTDSLPPPPPDHRMPPEQRWHGCQQRRQCHGLSGWILEETGVSPCLLPIKPAPEVASEATGECCLHARHV